MIFMFFMFPGIKHFQLIEIAINYHAYRLVARLHSARSHNNHIWCWVIIYWKFLLVIQIDPSLTQRPSAEKTDRWSKLMESLFRSQTNEEEISAETVHNK